MASYQRLVVRAGVGEEEKGEEVEEEEEWRVLDGDEREGGQETHF